jgi:hypothetical protein
VPITVGCVLAPVSALAAWAASQVSDTDWYVANMAPLIRDPAIQHALSARITAEIENRIDVGALVSSTTTLRWVLPFLALALLAAGIWASPMRDLRHAGMS